MEEGKGRGEEMERTTNTSAVTLCELCEPEDDHAMQLMHRIVLLSEDVHNSWQRL
jgi:hypothetical protein